MLAADGDLPTSLHRIGGEVMPFSHATVMGEFGCRVRDSWIAAVAQYDDRAKIVIVLQPVPRDITTEYAGPGEGVPEVDLPPWMGDLLQCGCATRDVPISAGESLVETIISGGT